MIYIMIYLIYMTYMINDIYIYIIYINYPVNCFLSGIKNRLLEL